jgi:hypothetical protein
MQDCEKFLLLGRSGRLIHAYEIDDVSGIGLSPVWSIIVARAAGKENVAQDGGRVRATRSALHSRLQPVKLVHDADVHQRTVVTGRVMAVLRANVLHTALLSGFGRGV